MKNSNSISNRKMYNEHIKSKLNQKTNFTTFRNIIHEYNKIIADQVLDSIDGHKFYGNEGKIYIVKNKPKTQPINLLATKQAGKIVRWRNDHSFGAVYKFCWVDRGFIHHKIWKFKPSRANKRRLKENVIKRKHYLTGSSW